MNAAIPAGAAFPGDRVDGDGAVPGLKARANPTQCKFAQGRRRVAAAVRALHGNAAIGMSPTASGQGVRSPRTRRPPSGSPLRRGAGPG